MKPTELWQGIFEIMERDNYDHLTVAPMIKIFSSDEGHLIFGTEFVSKLVQGIEDSETSIVHRAYYKTVAHDIIDQLLSSETNGSWRTNVTPPSPDAWLHFDGFKSQSAMRNCGIAFDDRAFPSIMHSLRFLNRVAEGRYEGVPRQMYLRSIKFIEMVLNRTPGYGIPHTVNHNGVSIEARPHEHANIYRTEAENPYPCGRG